jgi:hypothetical protein
MEFIEQAKPLKLMPIHTTAPQELVSKFPSIIEIKPKVVI